MWNISNIYSGILKTLFPPKCYVCRKDGDSLCADCLKQFGRAVDTPSLYIKSVFSFKDREVKRIIHAIKYYHRKDLVTPLTRITALELNKVLSVEPLTSDWVLVPIPMPRIRQYLRGYNQAFVIAGELSRLTMTPVKNNLLLRMRSPKRQVSTSTRSERLKNQHNSFKVNGDAKNLNIILVDDVTTTGATIMEARSVLLKSGAKNVIAITIAH